MKRAFHLVNVFTRSSARFSGNPLCVFEDGSGLDDATMQAIALQFNLSETTFVLADTDASARVRIFTPHEELPFAGHPVLGTAHVLRELRGESALTLRTSAGPIAVTADGDRWSLTAAPATSRGAGTPVADIAAALSLEPADVAGAPLWVSTGMEQLMVPVRDVAAVRRARVVPERLDAVRSLQGRSMAAVFHDGGDGAVVMRFFFRKDASFGEDPATGSACANLGGWYLAQGAEPLTRTIFQGDHLGRPSTLHLEVSGGRIQVAGEVQLLGRGEITV